MKRFIVLFLVVCTAAIAVVTCGCGGDGNGAENGESGTVDVQAIQRIEGGFDFDLFRQVAEDEREGEAYRNFFLSPESLRIALMMAYNGAAGETAGAMASVLGIEGMTLEEANRSMSELLKLLKETGRGVEVEIADSLWAKEDIDFKDDFIERNQEYYSAEVEQLTTPGPINEWVDEKTQGKITEIVDEIKPNTILFLINALYFNGEWTNEFEESRTSEEDFTLQDGSTIKASLMHQSGTYRYMENDVLQAVEIPYGEEEEAGMLIFLPRNPEDLTSVVEQLSGEKYDEWVSQMASSDGDIAVPKFKLEYEKSLNDTLEALGMGIAFDPGKADFANMVAAESVGGENVYISEVLQKTYLDVNEKGTEAAAVTSVEVGVTSAPVTDRFEMVVDHPFLMAIRDSETGTILFMGLIANPAS